MPSSQMTAPTVTAAQAVQVSVVPEYETSPQTPCNSIRTVVSLEASKAPERSASLRLMLVLDRSGSMSGDRIELVKATTK